MKQNITKADVIRQLTLAGHQVVMDSAFVVGSPISEIEAIVDLCNTLCGFAYLSGMSDQQMHDTQSRDEQIKSLQEDIGVAYNNGYIDGGSYNANQRLDELTEYNNQLRVENKNLCERLEKLSQTNRELADCVVKKEVNESLELEKAIETIQVALSGSFRDNLKLEITEQYCRLIYEDLTFVVEPPEAWQAVQSCVYLSGLEVSDE